MVETRRSFHQQLDEVRDEIVRLAGIVTENIARGTQALLDGDLDAAEGIIEGDDELDSMTLDIEDRCCQLLALQQPMAVDLRTIVTDLRMVAEIERSGDLVVNMMKGARRLYGTALDPKVRGLITRLGEQVQRIFRLAIDAYIDRNDGLAAALDDMDDIVDELQGDFIQAVFESHATGNVELKAAVQLALVGRYYERIADHAVNIGERVRYMVTGWLPEHTGAVRHAVRMSGGPSSSGQAGTDASNAADTHGGDG